MYVNMMLTKNVLIWKMFPIENNGKYCFVVLERRELLIILTVLSMVSDVDEIMSTFTINVDKQQNRPSSR